MFSKAAEEVVFLYTMRDLERHFINCSAAWRRSSCGDTLRISARWQSAISRLELPDSRVWENKRLAGGTCCLRAAEASPSAEFFPEQRGEIWIRWMSKGLAWQLLILLLQEWSRTHLEQQWACVGVHECACARRVFLPSFLLFDTSIKAFKRLSRTVWHTWCGAAAMRCYHLE